MADKIKLLIADEAIAAARNEKFDLALLDFKMPGMDGKQVMEILKNT